MRSWTDVHTFAENEDDVEPDISKYTCECSSWRPQMKASIQTREHKPGYKWKLLKTRRFSQGINGLSKYVCIYIWVQDAIR